MIFLRTSKYKKYIFGFLLIFSILLFYLYSNERFAVSTENIVTLMDSKPDEFINLSESPISPIFVNDSLSEEKVKLGSRLFEDPQLSGNKTISCATCHNLNPGGGGVDGLVISRGIDNQSVGLNTPTVFNAVFNFRQFWDGRASTLEEQIDGPITNPKEMGSSWELIKERLSLSPEYVSSFKQLYVDGITRENIKNAIATFEKSLVTPDSPFDRFLKGDKNALTKEEKEGYDRFKNYGCVSCHQGVNVGGNLFQTFGLFGNYFEDRATPITKADLGRYNVTGKEEDRYLFKVPSLRNIELTSPYFHDGNALTLEEAIDIMGRYQLGINLTPEDIDLIIQFLRTLTGQYNNNSL